MSRVTTRRRRLWEKIRNRMNNVEAGSIECANGNINMENVVS